MCDDTLVKEFSVFIVAVCAKVVAQFGGRVQHPPNCPGVP